LGGKHELHWIPELLDAIIRSDQASPPGRQFSGAFVGMACQDMAGTGLHGDFDWFDCVERDYRADLAA
jgi:xylan 1,4-beta-xylosidase